MRCREITAVRGAVSSMFFRGASIILMILFIMVSISLSPAAESAASPETASGDSSRTDLQTYRISDTVEYSFVKPGKFDFLTNLPGSFIAHGKSYGQKKNLPILSAVLASTALLIPVDPQFITNAKSLGKDLNISTHGYSSNISPIKKYGMYMPGDLGTSLYFIGDGFVDLVIVAAYLSYGLAKDDNRALQTASQITEGLGAVLFWDQIMKHSFCRESPSRATANGGVWRLFHDPRKTFKDVPKYDAMPSGHMASTMLTLTVIADNYPEYKFIRPVGYTLMTALAFQMMNNGVHWVSDYPLGLYIGYDIAKHVTQKGRTIHKLDATGTTEKQSLLKRMVVSPAMFDDDGVGIRSSITF